MRIRARTVLLSLVGVLVLAAIGLISMVGWQVVLGPNQRAVTDRKFAVTDARLARGKYIVEGPAGCFHCHSDHDFTDPAYPSRRLGGGWAMPIPELGKIASRNITSDPLTGIGAWKDDEIARAIREGVSRDGSALFPLMPYPAFASLDDEDLESIVVYLRTVPAINNAVPKRELIFPLNILVNTMPAPLTAPQPSHPASTPVERGKYLVTIAECQSCHTPTDPQGQPLPGLAFGGGGLFHDPGKNMAEVFSANITSDPSGIAHYDEALFLQTIKTGQRGGTVLNHIMPFEFLKNMTDADLKDVWAYIHSVPPVKHRISNTDPPTMCPLCKQKHGLGDTNVAASH